MLAELSVAFPLRLVKELLQALAHAEKTGAPYDSGAHRSIRRR